MTMTTWMVAAAALVWASAAWAQPMQCGTGIINPGDSMERVLELCGQPQDARSWVQVIPGGDDDEGMLTAERIPMAEWLYDNDGDPDLFPQKVLFRNGIVQEISGS